MAKSDLTAIRDKVRRLTRSPSINQLTIANLDEYINTFVLYDMPENLRLFSLHSSVNFELQAYKQTYDFSSFTDANGETLSNAYITINPPVYIDGNKALFSQSREEFYNLYPKNKNIVLVGTGDAATTTFTTTISGGFLLPNNVVITSIHNTSLSLYAEDDGSGIITGDATGTVDYITGAITLTFVTPPGNNEQINAHIVQYTPGRPSAVLYFQNEITVMPVPDQPYTLNFEVYKQPTELLASGDAPDLKQWWQYIALGAALKLLYDRLDTETIAQIMPEYKNQERLVLRRTLVQNSTQKVSTIYNVPQTLGGPFNNNSNGF